MFNIYKSIRKFGGIKIVILTKLLKKAYTSRKFFSWNLWIIKWGKKPICFEKFNSFYFVSKILKVPQPSDCSLNRSVHC